MPDAHNLIPIYDGTAPIACTIGAEEIPDRIELLERMRSVLTSIDRTPTGLLLHFANEPGAHADIERFAVDEKRCCQFWGFAVTYDGDGVALRWDAAPSADELLAKVETFFRTDALISILEGLL